MRQQVPYVTSQPEVPVTTERLLDPARYAVASETFTIARAELLEMTKPVSVAKLRNLFWMIALLLGGIDAWRGRFWMNGDGISYLDLGDAYLRGDWLMIANAYWSPFYAWLLTLGRVMSGESPHLEFTVVSVVNFVIYIGALVSFHYLLTGIINYKRSLEAQEGRYLVVPEWVWLMLGYSIFLWSSLAIISLKVATPDLCVAGFTYLLCGTLLRIRMGDKRYRTFILFGLMLGVGYLAKAPLFPLSFVFLAVAALLVGSLKTAISRVSLALLVFLIVSAPLVTLLSVAKGRLTFGDSGRLNYAWFVNGVTYRHWQGEDPDSGRPLHATRRIMREPAIFEFGSPFNATYPLWYDPSYWYDGIEVPTDFQRQLKPILTGLKVYYGTFFNIHISKHFQNNTHPILFSPLLIIGLVILVLAGILRSKQLPAVGQYWFLLVPSLAGLCMYLLVYVEPRHVAAFPVLLYLGAFAGLRMPNTKNLKKLATSVIVIVSISFTILFAIATIKTPAAQSYDWQIAEGLRQMGIQPGDKVASLTYSNTVHTRWARLARVQIVAEMFTTAFRDDEDEFWRADQPTQDRIIRTFAVAGAEVIVAHKLPVGAAFDGWKRIGNTEYHAYFLRRRD